MDFKKLQEFIVENAFAYGKRNNVKIDKELAIIKLYEEVGEFSQALLIHQKKCRPEKYVSEEISKRELGYELADVLCLVVVNAHLLGIDLEDAIDKKWIKRTTYKI